LLQIIQEYNKKNVDIFNILYILEEIYKCDLKLLRNRVLQNILQHIKTRTLECRKRLSMSKSDSQDDKFNYIEIY